MLLHKYTCIIPTGASDTYMHLMHTTHEYVSVVEVSILVSWPLQMSIALGQERGREQYMYIWSQVSLTAD